MQTYVYHEVDGLALRADVYHVRPPGRRGPTVLYLHGGGLILGSRKSVLTPLFGPLLAAGATVVSLDYRLAPERHVAAMADDVRAAWRWAREQGPRLFDADPEAISIAGESAGGYLALLAGALCRPRPRAVISLYGFGDLLGAWATRPHPAFGPYPVVDPPAVTCAVGGSPVVAGNDEDRYRFYLYCRQHGLFAHAVTGHDPDREADAVRAYCPVALLDAAYPPTLIAHGARDGEVPYSEFASLAAALARAGVAHRALGVATADHGLGGATAEELGALVAAALDLAVAGDNRPSAL